MTTTTLFTFNGDYDDLEQVAEYLPAFLEVFAEVARPGRDFAYNADFIGRIPAIANTAKRGPNVGTEEEAAIYLLQGLKRARELTAKVEALLAEGYVHVESVDAPTRYRRVIFYSAPYEPFRGEWAAWTDARLVPYRHGGVAVLPKGKRTHGHAPDGRKVLVLA